mmetsp:Transcript_7192/g.22612  ORF Transcript_7192/g.22612 Transcript_7192/m.22612 type:complete len:109 (-) Transcript_7192:122-448(-)
MVLLHDAIAEVSSHGTPRSPPDCGRPPALAPASRQSDSTATPAEIEGRRDAICEALRRQRIPFQLQGCGGEDLLVLGCLRCVPPYNARAVSCENEIVLSRFTELLAGV